MKKSPLAIAAAISGALFMSSGYNVSNAYAKDEVVDVAVSKKEAAVIKALVDEIAVAAQSGDEQLVAKLLASAVKSNPKIAGKIVASFVASQPAASSVNVSSVINSVAKSLQGQDGGEALAAVVLSSYAPAAGAADKSTQKGSDTKKKKDAPKKKDVTKKTDAPKKKDDTDNNAPPKLPNAGGVRWGDGPELQPIQENPNITSPN